MGLFSGVEGISRSLDGIKEECKILQLLDGDGTVKGSETLNPEDDWDKTLFSYEVTSDPDKGEGWLRLTRDVVFELDAGDEIKWIAVKSDETDAGFDPDNGEQTRQENFIAYKSVDYTFENDGTLTVTEFKIKHSTSTSGA